MKKTFKVVLTKASQKDIKKIFDYISLDNPKNAVLFIDKIEEKILSLETYPLRNSYIPENVFFKTDYMHLVYKKYRIIYKIKNKNVFVLRVIHSAKNFLS